MGILGTSITGGSFMVNCLIADALEVDIGSTSTSTVFSQNHDQTANNHKIFMAGALISSATDQRHTASGISWKIQPTLTTRSSAWPIVLSLAKVACSDNNLVTIKAWMRRDNAGLTMRLVCKGGQIAGVASDVTASVTTTNAWEELTITFTPTETGVVEITAEAWGGSTFSGWVDDMTISQA
jgi:transcriptional regulator of nitric oxide reductase